MAEDQSNREIIVAQLQLFPGYKKMASNGWFMVQCPFHDDNTPSCGIRVAEPKLGVFNCLGCEAKGGWNKFAEKAGLAQIKEWNNGDSVSEDLVTRDLDDQLLGNTGTTFKQVIESFNVPEATLWPERIDWRGFPGWFMRKLGAHVVNDGYNESIGALFPVKVAGRVRGGVKAAFVKSDKRGALSYVTSRGQWVQDYGLFPYIYARGLIRKRGLKFIVLVEGPRDAMRLCLNGIPAVAVLGAKNITKRKMMFVTATGIDHIYAIPDADKAGKMMWKRVKQLASEAEVPARRIKLPEFKDGSKMDPGNAPKRVIRRIMDYLTERHGFEQPDEIH